jgi:hypothetical protein
MLETLLAVATRDEVVAHAAIGRLIVMATNEPAKHTTSQTARIDAVAPVLTDRIGPE